jgi:PAS domain S-box-containing protein
MTHRPTYEELERRIAQLERQRAEWSAKDDPPPAEALVSKPPNLVIFRLPDGMILDVNDAFLQTSGYAREDVLGRSDNDIGIWAEMDERRQFIDVLRECGEIRGFRAQLCMQNGQLRSFEIFARQVEIGGEVCAISISRDISDRKQQEMALRKQVSTLDSIFRAAPTGIGMVRERIIVAANQRLCDMLGYSQEALLNQSARLLYPSREEFEWVGREKYDQISRLGTGTVETRWKCKDGRIIDVLLSSAPIDLTDASQGVTFTALDITERKIAEHALEVQKSYLTTLHQTAIGLVGHLEPDDVLEAIVRNAVAFVEGADGFAYIYDSDSDELVLKAGTGRYAENLLGSRMKLGEGLTGRVAKSGQPMWVDDYRSWSGRTNHPVFADLQGALSVPILSNDQVLGVIGMNHFDSDRTFKSEEVHILSRFADLAAIALKNAGLYADLQKELLERRAIEKKLREKENLQEDIFESIQDGVSVLDRDLNILFVNRAMERIYGDQASLVGRRCYICYHGRSEPCEVCPTRRCFETGQMASEVVPGLPGSSVSWLEVFSFPIRDRETGEISGAAEFVRDISDRRKAEQNLSMYEQMVTSSSDYMALVGKDYIFKVVNAPYGAVMGRMPENIVGRPAAEIFGREIFDRHQKPKIDQCLTGEELRTKAWFDTPGLGRRFIDSAYYPSREEDGTISGVVMVGRDITDLRKLEDQLQQAQKMEAIGTLAGGVAHDFNNLLMGIQGRTSLMLSEIARDHAFHEHLEGIESYVKSAVDLTRQILGFARGGKYEVKATDLNDLVKTQNRMFSRTRKELTVRGKYEKNLWTVEVDQGQIKQVLLNLYVNAWQAMPGGGDLIVSTENVVLTDTDIRQIGLRPGRFVRVTVSDTGVGMDAATMARIFEPFFTTREMGRGTGLGLASAYGIIKNHGGLINVYSEKGEGSTFSIYLPAAYSAVPEEPAAPDRLVQGQGTLLLVDDEQMILDVGSAMLRKLGYRVQVAGSGDEALRIYRDQKAAIDLVILDMVMPGMGGGEVFDRLKAFDPAVRVVLSSGYSINGKASVIIDRGCVGFIQKPFNLVQLSQKVQAALAT